MDATTMRTSRLILKLVELHSGGEPVRQYLLSDKENSARSAEYRSKVKSISEELDRRLPATPAKGESQ